MRVELKNKKALKSKIVFFTTVITMILLSQVLLISEAYCLPALCNDNYEEIEKTSSYSSDEIKKEIEKIYNKRSEVFVTGDLKELPQYFDASQKYGKWALEHEVQRVKYLKHWAHHREIDFTDVNSSVLVTKFNKNNNRIKVSLKEICKFDYVYKNDEKPVKNSFAVGIRHTVTLVKKGDEWVIWTDWYTDCFEDALKRYTGEITELDFTGEEVFDLANNPKVLNRSYEGRYNRMNAVDYANKYCGASLEEGSNFKYNKKYSDYNGIGGDCTNFASQVLADKEAGGLKSDGTWFCAHHKFGKGEGSKAWVNADSFKNYVVYSGKGRVIKKGNFKYLTSPMEGNPWGAVQSLQPGDLVCYAKGSNVDHFAVVTAWDSHGYPLVNSHTTDRYHVPWDLGWSDSDINFNLINIR